MCIHSVDDYWTLEQVQGGYMPEFVFHDALPIEWASLLCALNQDYRTAIEGVYVDFDDPPQLFSAETLPKLTKFGTRPGHNLPATAEEFVSEKSIAESRGAQPLRIGDEQYPNFVDLSVMFTPQILGFAGRNPCGYMCSLERSTITFADQQYVKIENAFSPRSELLGANYIAKLNPFVLLYREEVFPDNLSSLMYVTRLFSQSSSRNSAKLWDIAP
ncbi:hypothetical protein CBE89_07295 [Corynebacterium striatum]|uniref:Uncharacterized protein n=1 Tax=Corynebacterium striatum TaxID=43770 RepID=A0A2Z2IXP1_CORST|nr:hypothetical protein [Corynebacterium striatum]ART21316.1 hypothetical protein CBE89_07295 [Corynebacterium striatum]HAT1182025.1 hypothetical protein [Corynebacterium striatum]HAT1243564.1 hypothetical protein [Corynebacterium striatum]HAT6541126.1 hypothetical protein [Corynebacterium striatum]HAT6617579.1 hypothetical protein [Corynebacterium striatum]